MFVTRRYLFSTAAAGLTAAVASLGLANGSSAENTSAKTHVIDIARFSFSPQTLDVREGDMITWRNSDITPHTATATDKSWDTGMIKKGESKSLTVTSKMAGEYYCRYHPAMTAKLSIPNA
ncbi:cupredoxin domain-containing protein [Sneathiella marina]|uniref:Cupredoxin domain-containing protein n=1 Tax=Sneathiella marina TaxID=2950108 RepID=A0ABY4W526_9PROT|nr:cupredoxin domain-containing protein [Sneathiella marina]USG59741.1 cupredoxin domain-containing protein [Sneathiella marina]